MEDPHQSKNSRSYQDIIPKSIVEVLDFLSNACKNATDFPQKIHSKFSSAQNPHLFVLDLVHYGHEHRKNFFPNLANLILVEFVTWIEQNPHASQRFSMDMKKSALEIILTKCNYTFTEKICKIFEFEKDKEELKTIVDQHVLRKNYKQVCQVIKVLDMQYLYPFEKVVFPLLCQNNRSYVQIYFENEPDLQVQCARTMDLFCKNEAMCEQFLRLLELPPKSHDLKWLRKLLGSFIKNFNLPIELCPNLIRNRSYGAMNFLFHKRFIEDSMSNDSFKEMLLSTVERMPHLTNDMIVKLVCYNEANLAAKLADLLKIPRSDWPRPLIHHLENSSKDDQINLSTQGTSQQSEDNTSSKCFLKFRLSEDDIVNVDTLNKFLFCIEEISMSYDVVGVDAEWRPSCGICTEIISLLQVATWDNVYLFDILTLLEILEEEHWRLLLEKIFCHEGIIKLGYGISGDISMLIKAVESIRFDRTRFKCMVDLAVFLPQVCDSYPSLAAYLKDHSSSNASSDDNKGLSKVCQQLLEKPLEKSEQCSDWSRRPLRKAQILYAALDAYCLLQIYEQIHRIFTDLGLSVSQVFEKFLKGTLPKPPPVPKSPKKGVVAPQAASSNIEFPQTPISQFKVLVDNCLSGLGKQLRMRGADVLILGNGLSVSDLVKIVQQEERFVLSSGSRFSKILGYFTPENCLCVPQQDSASAQASFVCKHFNVIGTESDIFSRCTLCNSDRYLKVTSEDMQLLWAIRCSSTSPIKTQKNDMAPFITCDNGFITESGFLDSGVELQMTGLSSEVLLRGLMFFVCSNCGKVYWEGSHHKRTKRMLSEWIVNDSHSTEDKSSNPGTTHFPFYANDSVDSQSTDTSSTKSPFSEDSSPVYYVDTLSDEEEDDDLNDIVYQ